MLQNHSVKFDKTKMVAYGENQIKYFAISHQMSLLKNQMAA